MNLEAIAASLRITALQMITRAGSGHPGGALSIADIVAALYFKLMRIRPDDPLWEDRDRFILSKGHACAVWYAALAKRGFFPEEHLCGFRRLGGACQGHPDMRKLPGVDMTSGSLGMGLSAGVGMAAAGKMQRRDYRVYVILGDGELDEGQVWEAAMAAAKLRLDNLVAVVDRNALQVDGATETVMPLEPLTKKWEAFGWDVAEIDGHNIQDILSSLAPPQAPATRPRAIIAKTVKGRGVSFMEGNPDWHGRSPTACELARAIAELEGR